MNSFSVKGKVVDLVRRDMFPAEIRIEKGVIAEIKRINDNIKEYILPGFVDAHVHVESSMVTPVEFSRAAIRHGTISAVSDPHEIANVLGIEGISFMTENAERSPMKFLFGAPSCVPATPFESDRSCVPPCFDRTDRCCIPWRRSDDHLPPP